MSSPLQKMSVHSHFNKLVEGDCILSEVLGIAFTDMKQSERLFHPFSQVNKMPNQTFTSCSHTQSRSHHHPSASYSVTMASKQSRLKQGTPSLLHCMHPCTLDTLHKNSVRGAQGRDLYLIITTYEVLRLRDASWYTV